MSKMEKIIADSMDLWQAAVEESFLQKMGDGTLSSDLFRNYIIQDSIYLRYYLKAFAMGMFKASTLRDMQFLYSVLPELTVLSLLINLWWLRKLLNRRIYPIKEMSMALACVPED